MTSCIAHDIVPPHGHECTTFQSRNTHSLRNSDSLRNNSSQSKGEVLMEFLLNFYRPRVDLLKGIITQKSVLSLRLLDWLVTNYAKKYNIMYQISNKRGEKEYFNIFLSYKNQLKAYSKKYFDPFCRRDRIIINTRKFTWVPYCGENYTDEYIVTTVGQLNFFKWFIENKVLDYAVSNIQKIDTDMNITLQNNKTTKRRELSKSAVKGVYTSPTNVIIRFS
jgi:hypothetical protein